MPTYIRRYRDKIFVILVLPPSLAQHNSRYGSSVQFAAPSTRERAVELEA